MLLPNEWNFHFKVCKIENVVSFFIQLSPTLLNDAFLDRININFIFNGVDDPGMESYGTSIFICLYSECKHWFNNISDACTCNRVLRNTESSSLQLRKASVSE